jgi:hypothetical protein
MPYKHDAGLKAKLAELEAAQQVAKEAARKVARERAPMAKLVRDLMRNLKRSVAAKHKMIHGNGVCIDATEQVAARLHNSRWRDTFARFTALQSLLLDAEIRLALFDKEHTT